MGWLRERPAGKFLGVQNKIPLSILFHDFQTRSLILVANSFRWVEIQLESLRQCTASAGDLEQWLGNLPRTLHETYDACLLRSINTGSARTAQDARRVLNLVNYAPRPLSLPDVIDAIAVDVSLGRIDSSYRFHTFMDIQNLCPGMVDYTVHESIHHAPILTVRLAHPASVREYLASSACSALTRVDESSARMELLRVVLTYIMDEKYLEHCAAFDGDDEDRMFFVSPGYPLAEYASWYWLPCYRSCLETEYNNSPSSSINTESTVTTAESTQLVLSFFQNPLAFDHWLRWYNPDAQPDQYTDSSVHYDTGDFPSPAYYAALLGLDEILFSLVQDSASRAGGGGGGIEELINSRSGRYGNALYAAAAAGHLSCVKILLAASGGDLDAWPGLEDAGDSVLTCAAKFGHLDVVRYLLDEAGADVNRSHAEAAAAAAAASRLEFGYGPPLAAAVYGGHEEVVKALLAKGPDLNASSTCSGKFGRGTGTALAAAVVSRGDRARLVRLLLESGADVNSSGGGMDSCTALQVARSMAWRTIADDEVVKILTEWPGARA